MKQYLKSKQIPYSDVAPEYCDDDLLTVYVKGSNGEEYLVSNNGGYWRCTCPDFTFRGIDSTGSYLCKHCLKVITNIEQIRKDVNCVETEFVTAEDVDLCGVGK